MTLQDERTLELCIVPVIHQEAVDAARAGLPDDDRLYELADLYKMFADSTRVKILWALMQCELCVCDITSLLGVSQSAVSHQLRVLKGGRLVKTRRSGKVVYYSLADDHVRQLLQLGLEHIEE